MRDFRVSSRRRVAAAALSGVLDIFLVLLLPAGPGTAVLEVGGLCGFRWPVAVWEVWVAGGGGSACLSEMPLPPSPLPLPYTLSAYKSSQCFLVAHNEIHLQGCLFTRLWNTSVYQQGAHSQNWRWCIYKPVHGWGFLTSLAICGWSFLGRGDFWPECIWKDKYHTDISCQLQHRFTLLYAGAARNSQYID